MTATETTTNEGQSPPARLTASSRRVIAVLLGATFLVVLNETAMNVALTTIMADLGVTERVAQWLTTAFMLTMAVVIPTTGWLLRRFATKTVFAMAMSLFSVGTAICALAPGIGVLVGGRVVQAAGTAIMVPLLMTTIMQLTPENSRGKVMGNIALVIAVAPAVGPTASGLILQFFDWRFVFGFVLPISAAMLVLGALAIRNVATEDRIKLDAASIPLVAAGFGGTVYGLSLMGAPVPVWQPALALGIGLIGIGLFIWRQVRLQRADKAMLDLRTFRYREFTVGMILMTIAMMALFGTIIMLPIVLQKAMHLTPLAVGLIMLPGGLLMGILGPIVGRLYDRHGPRPLMVPASFVIAASLGTLATINPETPLWLIVACQVTMSGGFAFIFTPLFTASLGALPANLYSHGSAMLGTVQQLAGAAGTTLFVIVLAMQSAAAGRLGIAPDPAMLTGARGAFLAATALWVLAIVTTTMIRRPEVAISRAHS